MSRKKQCTPVPVIERTGTATIRSHTKFTKQLATLSLALLWLSLLNASTPTYVLPYNSEDTLHVLPQCDSTYIFISDTLLSHTYFDSKRRKSTITFCPQSSEQGVEVRFQEFDVAAGDTLFAYDGRNSTAPLIGYATGQGSNNAFGGKLCSPQSTFNAEGCLTFVFQTNGDGIGGTGWRADVSCAEQNLEIILPNIPNQQLVCGETHRIINIPPAQIINNCGAINNDYTFVKIREITTNIACGETALSANKNSVFTHPFGFGTFQLKYISIEDPALTDSLRFTISPAPLVCETEVELKLDNTCEVVLLPEMFVADYCPPILNQLHYNIVVRDKDDNIIANGSTLNDSYPALPLNTMDLCGNKAYLVEIQQVYRTSATSGICAENKTVQSCIIPLVIIDETPPIFIEPAQVDTLFACQLDLSNMLSLLTAPRTTDACGFSQSQLESIFPFNAENKCTAQPDYIITWSASDLCGNISTRIDTLKVHRPKIVQNFTVNDVIESCETNLDISTIEIGELPYLQEGMQTNGQFHPTNKIELSFTTVICNYQLQMEEVIRLTTCGKEVVRSWSLLDKCGMPEVTIPLDTQIIQLLDTIAPTFTNCSNFATLATAEQIDLPANSCQITLDFPLPTAIDNCDDKPIVKEFTVQELVNGEWSVKAISLFQTSLSIGTFRVGYETFNDCAIGGNADTCYRYFIINNPITPIINCSNFSTLATAEQFDLPTDDCVINLNFPLPSVLGSCNNSTVTEDVVQELVNGQWTTIASTLSQTTLSVGTYRVIYSLNVSNADICYRYFIVNNPIIPAIDCSTFSTLATAEQYDLPANECVISLNFPLPSVLGSCTNSTVREDVVQELVNGQWTTIASTLSQTALPVGTYRVIYSLDVNNTDICYRYFIVNDPIIPAIDCSTSSTLATAEQFDLPANDCVLQLNFPLPSVLGSCNNSTVREDVVQELVNGQWTTIASTLSQATLSVGTYRVIYSLNINSADICYRYFIINNPIIPAIDCSIASTLATAQQFDLPANDCVLQLNFPLPNILGSCNDSAVREDAVQELVNGQWTTIVSTLSQTALPVGTYRVVYSLNVDNTDICYRYFIINNPVIPAIDCSIASTLATAEQFDLPVNDCVLQLNFPLPNILGGCNDSAVREDAVQELVNGQWTTIASTLLQTTLPVGTYRVIYSLNVNNADICYRYFIINNPVVPAIDCSTSSTLATAEQFDLPAGSCQISLNFPLPSVLGRCNDLVVQEDFVQELVNGQWTTIASALTQTTLSIGTYRVVYSLNINTTNTDICFRYFIVNNPVTPVINCNTFSTLATAEQYNIPTGSCQISLNFPLPTVLDNCDNLIARELAVQELINGQWANIATSLATTPLPAGTFRVAYTFGFNNTDLCYRYFTITNPITPTINCNVFSTLATAEQYDLPAGSCQISLNFPLPTILNNCNNLTAREFALQELINGQWVNIANALTSAPLLAGTYRVAYTLGLNNTDLCYRYFIIRSPIAPSINCSNFSTLATAEQFNVSADNCQINLSFSLPTVLNNCDNVIARELAVEELINGNWEILATSLAQTSFYAGTFRVGYTIGINSTVATCYRYFQINDAVNPAINCSAFASLATAELIDLPINSCQIVLDFPLPTFTGNCTNPDVREVAVQELSNGQWTTIAAMLSQMALSVDTFRVAYTLAPDTQTDTCYRYFIVKDTISPFVTCRQDIEISLDENGAASLSADALSLAHGDNCTSTQLLIKRTSCLEGDMRMELDTNLTSARIDLSEFSSTIDFACCDLDKTIRLELVVIDASGNYSTCSTTTVPTENILPICEALPPAIGFCNEYQTTDFGRPTDVNGNEAFDLLEWLPILPAQTAFYNEEFGDPFTACTDNITCLNLKIEQEYQLIEGRCNSIEVKRRYRAVDFSGNTSPWIEQLITIEYRPDWLITFPADAFTNCEVDKITAPLSPIRNGACDRLSWTATDQIVEFTPGGILEVIRTFTVVNNCISQQDDQWEELVRLEDAQGVVRADLLVAAADHPEEGHFSYIQKIRVVDIDAPFLVLGTVDTRLFGKGDAEPFGEEDLTRESFPYECDEVREFSVFARDCNEPSTETLEYNWQFSNNGQVVQTGIGNSFFQTVLPDTLYTVSWMVLDVFGNQSDTSVTYQFVDAAPPTPICAKGITASISPTTRMVTVSADTLDGGSFDNCDDQSILNLQLWSNLMRIDTPQTLAEIQALPTEFPFSCSDEGEQELLLYVSDASGNFAACTTRIEILADSTINCDETMIGGTIIDRFGVPIQNTSITILGQDIENNLHSNAAGNYDVRLPMYADYTIKPSITTNPLNGISTYDLVLLSQHIVGNKTFTSPYQYIAGDVNRSGSITAFDLVQLRQLILNKIKEFPNNDSWRFINTDYQFEEANPLRENIEEAYTIKNLTTANVYMDFIGVKVGDINGDATTSNLQQVQQRQSGTNFYIHTFNQRLEKGKFYTVPFHAPQLENIIGFQGTFKFHDLILTNITGGKVTPEHFHGWRQGSTGYLTTSWHSLYSHDNNTAPFLFSLTFQAMADGQLHELLQITSKPTTAEAYGFSGEWLNLSLTFQNKDRKNDLNFGISPPPSSSTREPTAMLPLEGGVFEVFPNKPNPFDNYTIISFYIPQPTLTALSVFNIHGQSILQTQQIYPQGTNQIKFDSDQIPNGTYFYQVATSYGVATHKMVVAK